MRVTSSTFSNNLINHLNTLGVRQSRLQTQVSTGQRITSPADDPVAMRRVMDLQAAAGATAQYQANISRLQGTATASYDAIRSIKSVSDRAGEITTLADGLKSPDQLKSYATEINSLIKQAVLAANSQDQGNYIFGGTKTDQPPFAMTTDADGNVTGVTYQGNASVSDVDVATGTSVAATIPGANSSGAGPRGLITDARAGADLFNHLISLADHLRAGDTAAIASTDKPQIANDESNVIYNLSQNATTQSKLETFSSQASSRSTSLEQGVSKETDTNLADTLVRMNETQNAYQATLKSAGTV
ncbi:MAG TPA: flagellar hook-associated protein FlgL, partial [Candidatus Limnocylindria bacterium]|nr:flagellar hook-associated protein FlgL [Candidatus Limnocylindria bacterium]